MLILYQPTHPCLGPVYAEASVYAEDRERPREALGGGALTTWHPHPTPGSGPQGVGIHHPAQCPGWGRRCEAPGHPYPCAARGRTLEGWGVG